MLEIPKEATQVMQFEGQIPNSVTELPQDSEPPEATPYVISFAKYNEKMCEISALGKNKGNKALSILKDIGMNVFSRGDFQKKKIQTSNIINKGAYKPLYNKLGPDIEIKEMFLQGNGRIFYFDIEPEKALYIVAITENHLETNKVKR